MNPCVQWILAALMLVNLASCLSHAAIAEDARITVLRDWEAGTRTVTIVAEGGQLRWIDVLRGLAQLSDLDPSAIQDEFAARTLDLGQSRTRWGLRAVSAAVPDVKLRIVPDAVRQNWVLSIRLETRELRDKVRRLKARLRDEWTGPSTAYGLRFDEGWDLLPPNRPLVVLIHGYSAGPSALQGLQGELRHRGWPLAVFTYPNDGPLGESAELLSGELQEVRTQYPTRTVAIVAHSLGGLVARAVVEDSELDPGNVAQLILVATPNHGSQWAVLPGGLDWWEYLHTPPPGTLQERFLASIADGLDEARGDVRPESDFLRALNARPRNPRVGYSLILGTAAPFEAQDMRRLRGVILREIRAHRAGRLLAPRIERFFDGLTEIERGQGDGVVAVERGRLEGVADTLLLPMTHSDLTRDLNHPHRRALRDAILERLAGRTLHPLLDDGGAP